MPDPDYRKAEELMRQRPDLQEFAGSPDPEFVWRAEEVLGFELPRDYRKFVLTHGAGSFGATEVYGITGRNFADSSVPNGIWYTLSERRSSGLAQSLVVIGSDGAGNLICLDCSLGEDPPVVLVEPGSPTRTLGELASSFGSYLLQAVKRETEAD